MGCLWLLDLTHIIPEKSDLQCCIRGTYTSGSSRGARMSWYATHLSRTNNRRIQHFSSQIYSFFIKMTTYTAKRGWSSKSKPYNKKAVMLNWKQMAGKWQRLNLNNDWIVSCLICNISQHFTWYFCHGFVNLLTSNILSLRLILPVFTVLAINYTKRYFPSLQARAGRQLYSLHRNPRNLAWVQRIGLKPSYICKCIIKRSGLPNYTKYNCESPRLITTNDEREHQIKTRNHARKEDMSTLTSQHGCRKWKWKWFNIYIAHLSIWI